MTAIVLSFTLFITIDDVPNRETKATLDFLKAKRIKVCFFIMGVMLRNAQNRALLRRMVKEGHSLGNHLYSHKDPCKLTVGQFLWELNTTQKMMEKAIGRKLPKIYRPPHGKLCHWPLAKRLGYKFRLWDIADSVSAPRILRAAMRKGSIVLLYHSLWKLKIFVNRILYGWRKRK